METILQAHLIVDQAPASFQLICKINLFARFGNCVKSFRSRKKYAPFCGVGVLVLRVQDSNAMKDKFACAIFVIWIMHRELDGTFVSVSNHCLIDRAWQNMERNPNRFSEKDCRIACCYDPNCMVAKSSQIFQPRVIS